MAKLRVADFYYGCVLSMLLNAGVVPVLIDRSSERRVYEFTTNSGNIRLFIKYRSKPNSTKREDYHSWKFSLTDEDIKKLRCYMKDERNELRMALVLGMEHLDRSELAILNVQEVEQLLQSGKTSFTITRKKGEKAFRVILTGSRRDALKVPCTRDLC